MSAALQQLRRAIIAGDRISVDDTSVVINDNLRLRRSAETNLRCFHGRGEKMYKLEDVYFQYTFRDLPYNDYLQECNKKGVNHVVAIDKKDVVAYLSGRTDSIAGLVVVDSGDADGTLNDFSSSGKIGDKSDIATHPSFSSPLAETKLESKKEEAWFTVNRHRVRDQRSIDSVLMVKDWDFSSLREKLSQHVSAAKKGRPNTNEAGNQQKQNQLRPGQGQKQSAPTAAKTYDPRGDRYTNNEDRFWRENMGSDFQEFGIDMSGSFKAKPSSSSQPSNTNSSSSSLSHRKPQQQMSNTPSSQHSRASANYHNNSSHNNTKPGGPPSKRQKIDPKKATPIIIIPAGTSSLLFPGNVVEFLQNGHFMSVEDMRTKKLSMTQPGRLTVWRKPGGNTPEAQYHIVSNPNRLTRDEWNQVVAVVLSGQAWQFKQWPIFKGDTIHLFKKVQGFYFHYDDVQPTGDVNKWTIRKLTFPRDRRHNDEQVQAQFWNIVDGFIARNRLPLHY